jgi:hypothetical protein
MATQKIDERHDVTIRPVDKVAPGQYQCEAIIGLTDGSLTNSRFIGYGSTAAQAEREALRQAKSAIHAGKVQYRLPRADA